MDKVYSVYDKKMAMYTPPFYVQHEAQALRMLTTTVNQDDTNLSMYPEDFDLYYIGQWDSSQGCFQEETPKFVINAATLKRGVLDAKNLHSV